MHDGTSKGMLHTSEKGGLGHLLEPAGINAQSQALEVGLHDGGPHPYVYVHIASKDLSACMHSQACTQLQAGRNTCKGVLLRNTATHCALSDENVVGLTRFPQRQQIPRLRAGARRKASSLCLSASDRSCNYRELKGAERPLLHRTAGYLTLLGSLPDHERGDVSEEPSMEAVSGQKAILQPRMELSTSA